MGENATFKAAVQAELASVTLPATPTTFTQTYSSANATHASRTAANPAAATAAALTDSSGGAAADGTILACPIADSGYLYLPTPAAASTTGGAAQYDVSLGAGAMATIVQPDVPRNIVINFTDANASISAFQVDVVGVAPDGTATAEQFVFAGGLDQVGSVIHARITSVTLTSVTGQGAGDMLDIGYGSKLGVPVPFGSTGLSIRKLVFDNTQEAASATDTTNNSFTCTSSLDGTKAVEVWFSYNDLRCSRLRDAISELADQVNKLITDVEDIRTQLTAEIADALDTAQLVNSVVDAVQAAGL